MCDEVQGSAKKEVFGFLSEDQRLKRKLCHVFSCGTDSVASSITRTVSDAFKQLKERKAALAANPDPFAVLSSARDPVPPKLFKSQLHRTDLVAGKAIGAGQFGQVYLAEFKGETSVAVKTVRLAASDEDKEDFIREAEVMLELQSEGLCKLIGVSIQQRPWLCVIEFMM